MNPLNEASILRLAQNAALLVAMAGIFELIPARWRIGKMNLLQVPLGLVLGGIGIVLMLTSWDAASGIYIDSRTVLIVITGLFGGLLPALIAALLTSAFRFYQGGAGVAVGIFVIMASCAIGLGWRHLRRGDLADIRWHELFGLGILVHLVVLATSFTLPWTAALNMLRTISLPVMLIFPLETTLLGLLVANRLRGERTRRRLVESETRLRESETAYTLLTENIKEVVWILDVDTMKLRYISPSIMQLRGYTPEEVMALPTGLGLAEEISIPMINIFRKRAESYQENLEIPGKIYTDEMEQPCKDGTTVWTEVISNYYVNPVTGRLEVRGVTHDISERRKSQEKIRFQSMLLEQVGQAVIATDPGGEIRYWNRAAEELLGWNQAEVLGLRLKKVVPDRASGAQNEELNVNLCAGRRWTGDFEIRRKDGNYFPAVITDAPIGSEAGGLAGIVRLVQDASERKQADERTRAELELLRICQLVDNIPELMQVLTGFFKRQTGVEAVGIRLQQGEDFPYFESTGFPAKFVRSERLLCSYTPSGEVIRDPKCSPLLDCICGNVICGRTDPTQPFFTPNGSFWTNGTTELLANTTEADRQARTRNRCNKEGFESVVLIPMHAYNRTFGLVQLNDRQKDRFSQQRIQRLEKLVDFVAIAVAKLETEQTLRESEERFRSFVENAGDVIYTLSREGIFTYASPNITEALGYQIREVLGLQYEAMVHPDDILMCRAFLANVFATGGKQGGLEFRVRHKNGSWAWYTTNASLLHDANGEILSFLGIGSDITARKTMEARLRANLAEKDVLLREIHHRVKNNLAAILGLMDLERQAATGPHESILLLNLGNRIKAMATVHEKLYRSENLSQIDFQDYLRSFISHLRTSFQPAGNCVCQVETSGVALSLDIAVPCGLIVNELVTNTLKYAFPEGKPGVPGETICAFSVVMKQVESQYTLTVADNGIGISEDLNWREGKTIGLRLVRMLAEHQLGGRVDLDRSAGTRVTIQFDPRQRV